MLNIDVHNLILNNITDKDFLNPKFLLELRNKVLLDKNMESLLESIEIRKLKLLGLYAYPKIYLSTSNLQDELNLLGIKYKYDIKSTFVKNMVYLATIIHELIHVYQTQVMINDYYDNAFKDILLDSNLVQAGQFKKNIFEKDIITKFIGQTMYKKYHNIFPGEYNAISLTYLYLIAIYNQMDSRYKDKMEAYIVEVLYRLFAPYKLIDGKLVSPTSQFYKIAKLGFDERAYSFNEFDTFEKFSMGVIDDFESINEIINRFILSENSNEDHAVLVKSIIKGCI